MLGLVDLRLLLGFLHLRSASADGTADHDGGRLRVRTRSADENVYPGREITNIRLPARLQPVGLTGLTSSSVQFL